MRKFQGHKAGLTDMAFSHDGRWLVTSSLDTTTRFGSIYIRILDPFSENMDLDFSIQVHLDFYI